MSSLSFDSVAHIYDATRGYPDDIAQQIAGAIEKTANATPQTAFLEVGIGTGRIALPLASLGHNYTGVDISEKMIEQLVAKLGTNGWQERELPWGHLPDEAMPDSSPVPIVRRFTHTENHASMRLVVSDMTHLPFRDASFDAVVAVHVFHLTSDWQDAIKEVLRVLRPGGLLLHGWDENGMSNDLQSIGEEWRKIVTSLGGSTRRPGAPSKVVTAWLLEQGLPSENVNALTWHQGITPRQAIESFERRDWSSTWVIPDDIFSASIERLWQWANDYFGPELDTERAQERHFMISKTQT